MTFKNCSLWTLKPSTGFWIAASVLLFVIVTVFYPGITGGFILDDRPNITENYAIYIGGVDHYSLWRAATGSAIDSGNRPLAMLSFALDFVRAGKMDAASFKSTNIAIHVITAIFLTDLFRKFLNLYGAGEREAKILSLWMAACWAIHPLQISTVLYVVQRMQMLSTLFAILTLRAYLDTKDSTRSSKASYTPWIRILIWSVCALASKEDAVLIPIYIAAIELTMRGSGIFGIFLSRKRWKYSLSVALALLGLIAYLAARFWSTEDFAGRDFNSYERLLTQSRVLVRYLYEILFPALGNMPFYYDGIEASQSLMDPTTTALSVVGLAFLFAIAIHVRKKNPLFSLGILLFFAGHAVTSSFIGLELAFEHRNSFPLIGIVLAVGGLIPPISGNPGAKRNTILSVALLTIVFLGHQAHRRATIWGDNYRFAKYSASIATNSARAWLLYCRVNFEASHGQVASHYFTKAIDICSIGSKIPYSAALPANVVILKTLNETVSERDWNLFLERLKTIKMSAENKSTVLNLVTNARHGVKLEPLKVLSAIEILENRSALTSEEHIAFGFYLLSHTLSTAYAIHHLSAGLRLVEVGSTERASVLATLRKNGRNDIADRLQVAP